MNYHFIIVGGGLVGASLAIALSNTPYKIGLIDAQLTNQEDHRLFALNISSCQMLMNLNLWQTLKEFATPIHEVHVSRKKQFGTLRLNCQDLALPALGYLIPAKYLEKAINDKLNTVSNIELLRPARLKNIEQNDDGAQLTLDINSNEKMITAANVIAADGTHSTVRKILNFETESYDYQQSALVARISLTKHHHHVAHERFLQQGAIAMLPLGEHECAMIWSDETKKINSLHALSHDEFLSELQHQFGNRLGRFKAIAERYVYPLKMVCSKEMSQGIVFLLGNAAHTIHPIAAQGLNLALFEVAILQDHIQKKALQNQVLTATEMRQMSHMLKTQQRSKISLSHGLANLFAKDINVVKLGLQCGMLGFNMITSAKKKFIERMIYRDKFTPTLFLSADEI